ncbi:MAG: CPBP family intramembrane metalloprotease [Myxococcales bacterium]
MTASSAGRWPLESRARLVHALALVALLAAGFPLMFAMAGALGLAPEKLFAGDRTSFIALACFSLYRVGLVTLVGLFLAGKVTPRALGWHGDEAGPSLVLGALGGLGAIALCLGIALGLAGAEPHGVASTLFGYTLEQRLMFTLIACDAAFAEESLFRGYLQPALVKRLGLGVGVLVTASIFSVYHLNFTPLALVSKLALGLAFGLLRGRDRPLWVSGIAHAMLWVVLGML